MKKFILSLVVIAVLASCSADEQATYQDDLAYVGFVSSAVDLKVPINSTSSVDLVLRASNKSNVARTYNVAVIAAQTDANSATYSFPATFSIPADSYTGTLTVTGTDNNLINATIKKLTLKISGFGTNESFDNDKVVINIVEVCPVNSANFPGNFSSANFYNDGISTVYQVVAGTQANTFIIRNFFEGATSPDLTITYDPSNNRVSFVPKALGIDFGNGPVSIRVPTSGSNFSSIDGCTGRISLWIEYWLPNTNQTYRAAGYNEIFAKR